MKIKLLFLHLLLLSTNALFAQFSGGNGTAANPYQIKTAKDLDSVRYFCGSEHKNKHFRLMNNIDIKAYTQLTYQSTGWLPIGSQAKPAVGYFDGGGYKVTGLYIHRATQDNVGFWGYVDGADISRVAIEVASGDSVTGGSCVGILVGYINNADVVQCAAAGKVVGSTYIGVLAGRSSLVNVSQSGAKGTASGERIVGGFAGGFQFGSIQNSYAQVQTQGKQVVGGFLGYTDATHTNCYAAGSVKGQATVGAFVGNAESNSLAACFYSQAAAAQVPACGNKTLRGLFGKTATELMKQSTFAGWDFANTWKIDEKCSYPTLIWEGNQKASNAYLENIVTSLPLSPAFKYNVFEYTLLDSVHVNKVSITGTSGCSKTSIQGNVSRQIVMPGANTYQIVVTAEDTSIKNTYKITLVKSWFAGGSGTASNPYQITTAQQLDNLRYVCGEEYANFHYILMKDISLNAFLLNKSGGWLPIGSADKPFIGVLNGNGKSISYFFIDRKNTDYVGLFGYLKDARIENLTFSLANPTPVDSVVGKDYVGVLAGYNDGSTIEKVFVKTYTKAYVKGSDFCGGIVGYTNTPLRYCYSTIAVNGNNYVGGLCGRSTGAAFSGCWAAGKIKSTGSPTLTGALLGSGSVSDCYFDKDLAGTDFGVAGSNPSGSNGKTTYEMTSQATFSNWDFNTTWKVSDKYHYPAVKGLTVTYVQPMLDSFVFDKLKHIPLVPAFHKDILNYAMHLTYADSLENGFRAVPITNSAEIRHDGNYSLLTDNGRIRIGSSSIGTSVDFPGLTTKYTIVFYRPRFDGKGTAADPYQITDAYQLNAMRDSAAKPNLHFRLMNDINLSEFLQDSTRGWLPIGTAKQPFLPAFHGGGHQICGLFIYRVSPLNGGNDAGFFGCLGGNVDSLNIIISSWIVGVSRVGGLAGSIKSSSNITISHCAVLGDIYGGSNGVNDTIGGLIGRAYFNAIIQNCYTEGNLNGHRVLGGLVGYADGVTIKSCVAGMKITTPIRTYVGNIVGYPGSATLSNTYFNMNRDNGYNNCGVASGLGTDCNGTSKVASADVKKQASFPGLDFSEKWRIWENNSLPFFSWLSTPPVDTFSTSAEIAGICDKNAPIDSVVIFKSVKNQVSRVAKAQLHTTAQNTVWYAQLSQNTQPTDTLYAIAYEQGKSPSLPTMITKKRFFAGGDGTAANPYQIVKAGDLDALRNYKGNTHSDKYFRLMNDIDLTEFLKGITAGWAPIGGPLATAEHIFYGHFHGGGHTISGLRIKRSTTDYYVGLFAVVGGTIDSVSVIADEIDGTSSAVTPIVGTGALAGSITTNAAVSNVYAHAHIRAKYHSAVLFGAAEQSATIKNVFATGSVVCVANKEGSGTIVGKIQSEAKVENAYTLASLQATVIDTNIAGVAGAIYHMGSTLRNVIALNPSISAAQVGKVTIDGSPGFTTISNTYSLDEMVVNRTKTTNAVDGTSITSAQAKELSFYTTPANWDAASPWDISNVNSANATNWKIWNNNAHPHLAWQSAPVKITKIGRDTLWGVRYPEHPIDSIFCKTDGGLYFRATVANPNASAADSSWFIVLPKELPMKTTLNVQAKESGRTFSPVESVELPIFGGGDGTRANPYQIWDALQLSFLNNFCTAADSSKHYRIMRDIDLADFLEGNANGWRPIGISGTSFYGKLHGGGHTISSLRIKTTLSHSGLFGYTINASFDSLHIAIAANDSILGTSYVGGLVGRYDVNKYGEITDCSVEGKISAIHYTGALTGYIYTATANTSIKIDRCSAKGELYSKNNYVGGLIGATYLSTGRLDVSNSYFIGKVRGPLNVGGFIGQTQRSFSGIVNVTNAYAVAEVKGAANSGGFIGYNYDSVSSCYFDMFTARTKKGIGTSDLGGRHANEQVYGLPSEDMTKQATFAGWDFNNVWQIDEGQSFPYLKGTSPTYGNARIGTFTFTGKTAANEEVALPFFPAMDSIMRTYTVFAHPGIVSVSISGQPTCSQTSVTSITDHPITQEKETLKITSTPQTPQYAATYNITVMQTPFEGSGSLDDPFQIRTVQQLNLLRNYLGRAYIGWNYRLMNDLDLTDFIKNEAQGWTPIAVFNSYFYSNFHGGGHVIKGLRVDRKTISNSFDASLFGCLRRANIDSLGVEFDSIVGRYAGALAASTDSSFISECYAVGNYVKATSSSSCGGALIGSNKGVVENCYGQANVIGGFSVGGLVGYNVGGGFPATYIRQSYSVGTVSGTALAGAFVGDSATNAKIEKSYFNKELNPTLKGVGRGASSGTFGRTALQMMQDSTFKAWDFTSVWKENNGCGYPQLAWETTARAESLKLDALIVSNSDASQSFTLSPAFHSDTLDYLLVVDKPTDGIRLSATSACNGSAISGDTGVHTLYPGKNVFTVMVGSEVKKVYNVVAFRTPFDGEGTAANPYQIYTAEHLNFLHWCTGARMADKHYRIMNDIDLEPYILKTWTPIGSYREDDENNNFPNAFHGHIHGGGHAISGLHIAMPDSAVGLFGYAHNATFDSLGVEVKVQAAVQGGNYSGALVGWLAGKKSEINQCYATGHVSGTGYAGGLAGRVRGVVSNSYSIANVAGNSYPGGLVGRADSLVEYSYAAGTVQGAVSPGGLIGYSNGKIDSCYFRELPDGVNGIGGGQGVVRARATAQMLQDTTYKGWDFTTTWASNSGCGVPHLLWQSSSSKNNINPQVDSIRISGGFDTVMVAVSPMRISVPFMVDSIYIGAKQRCDGGSLGGDFGAKTLSYGENKFTLISYAQNAGFKQVDTLFVSRLNSLLFTVSASAGAGGSISPVGDSLVMWGLSVIYTISPSTSYVIDSVIVNGRAVPSLRGEAVASYTIANIQSNSTIRVVFALRKYMVKASAGANGSISPVGDSLVAPGSNITYAIAPSVGYQVDSVVVNGVHRGTPHYYTFTNIQGDSVIRAVFRLRPQNPVLTNLTISSGGSMTPPFDTAVTAYAVQLPCGVTSATLNFSAGTGGSITINGSTHTDSGSVVVPLGAEGSSVPLPLEVSNSHGSTTYTLSLITPFSSQLLHQTFAGTLEVVNNPAENGGYTFAGNGYTWYVNGVAQPVSGGVLYLPGGLQPGATYGVQVTNEATGEGVQVCPHTAAATPLSLRMYPNPVVNSLLTIDNGERAIGAVHIFDANGTQVHSQHFGEQTRATLPVGMLQPGTYVVRCGGQSAVVIKNK